MVRGTGSGRHPQGWGWSLGGSSFCRRLKEAGGARTEAPEERRCWQLQVSSRCDEAGSGARGKAGNGISIRGPWGWGEQDRGKGLLRPPAVPAPSGAPCWRIRESYGRRAVRLQGPSVCRVPAPASPRLSLDGWMRGRETNVMETHTAEHVPTSVFPVELFLGIGSVSYFLRI